MAGARRRPEGRNHRPSAFFSPRDRIVALLRRLLLALMVPVSRLYALWLRLRVRLHAMGLCRTCRPDAVVVGVGGMSAESRGRELLTSWLHGCAGSQDVGAAVVAPLAEANPPVLPFQVSPGGDPYDSGIEAALLASYVPAARCLVDAAPLRAATAAMQAFSPHMLILQDALGDPRLRRDTELAILTADDLGAGWNRVFPAGSWRRDASALRNASAYCVFAGPAGLDAALAASPYIAILGESDRELLPDMLRRHIGASPRMIFFVHDRHRFTRQDFEFLRADAERLKARNILTSPRFELKLRQGGTGLYGHAVWTYDPEVVFGPSLNTGQSFLAWWESAFLSAAKGRIRPR